jgi:hypothetical protein
LFWVGAVGTQVKAQCPHPFVVGTNVGIPTLPDAVAAFGWTISNDVFQGYDFCVSGSFTIVHNPFSILTIQNCQIQLLNFATMTFASNSNTIGYTLNSVGIVGDGNNAITFQGGGQQINSSVINNIAIINNNAVSQTIDNNTIVTNTAFNYFFSFVSLLNSTFNDSPFTFNGFFQSNVMCNNNTFNRVLPAFTANAITVNDGGYYIGSNNVFNNFNTAISHTNSTNLGVLIERRSVFNGNGINNINPIIGSSGGKRIVLQSNVFNQQRNHAISISENNVSTEILGNQFTTAQAGLRNAAHVIGSSNIQISNNNYHGQNNPIFTPLSAIYWIVGCKNLFLFSNSSQFGFNDFGAILIFCDSAYVGYNNFELHQVGISTNNSNLLEIEHNNVYFNLSKGISLNSVNQSNYRCNLLTLNKDGLHVSNTNLTTFFPGNRIDDNSRGLVYQPMANAPPQMNQGNIFVNNTLGAIFEGSPNPLQISLNTYFYNLTAPGNVEFPGTVIPATGWFVGNTNTSFTCFLPLPENEEEIKRYAITQQLLSLIECQGEESINGRCFYNLIKAIELIGDEPYLLEVDNISAFYNQYSESTIAQLPTEKEILRLIVRPVENLPDFPEPGDLSFVTNEEIAALEEYKIVTNEIYAQHESERMSDIAAFYEMLASIEVYSSFEDKYVQSVYWLMDVLQGNSIESLSFEEIQHLAESCIETDGSAVILAQIVLSHERILYQENELCHEHVSARKAGESVEIEKEGFFPNPVYDKLYVTKLQDNPNLQIEIYDLQGRLVIGWKHSGLHAIDVQSLTHGLYILRLSDGSVHRFVKI